ncbi:fructosamine kinase family protein [Microtetraspora malaysiensis]|uniref:Fructosamine kinase family protein n=1 Tax=Microtetraspora malaysiensis TaxID=161358 RepID=A0ABW6SZZ3_9ACTN
MRITRDLGSSHAWTLHEGEIDGRRVFVKRGADFASEAAGLRWLAEAGAVAVPEVIEAGDGTLVLEWIEPAHASAAAAERFGRELAELHRAGAPGFGAPWPGHIAELPMDNTPDPDWPSFYVRRRVLPFVRLARDGGALTAADVKLIEEACDLIPEVCGPAEPPSRIHGDLWSGNVLWTASSGGSGAERAVLIDPAAHGGHRETDLAMLALFGAPQLNPILAAYREAAPLADGWRERVPMHQFHPLLVHVCLYGEAYRGSLLSAVSQILAL